MKLINFENAETIFRDDGRTIKKLCYQELGMSIDNLEFIFVKHPKNFTEQRHSHQKSFEIFYFLDSAEYYINGKEYNVLEGDLIIFEPGDIHGGIPTENEVRLFIISAPKIIDDKQLIRG
tara:strand:+ start:876 stop:1235 length:360 start_codon:yes stop_codon:yes gene_type:complete